MLNRYIRISSRFLIENAKKIRKSLAVCENIYNFAAVFQIYVNKRAMLQQRMNMSTLLPLQGKECFGGFCYVHTNDSMSIAARDWYTPNFQRTSSDRESDRTA
jgi:hypothetical protein